MSTDDNVGRPTFASSCLPKFFRIKTFEPLLEPRVISGFRSSNTAIDGFAPGAGRALRHQPGEGRQVAEARVSRTDRMGPHVVAAR